MKLMHNSFLSEVLATTLQSENGLMTVRLFLVTS
jgi:hypothetical protein